MMILPGQTTFFLMFAILIGPCAFVLATNSTETSYTTDFSAAETDTSFGTADDFTNITTSSTLTALTHITSTLPTQSVTTTLSNQIITATQATTEKKTSTPSLSSMQSKTSDKTTSLESTSSSSSTPMTTSISTTKLPTATTQQNSSLTTSFRNCQKEPDINGYSFTFDHGSELNSPVSVTCSTGYIGTPKPSSVTCLAEGVWSNVTGCQKVDCHEPHATGYDFTIEQGTLFNSTAGVVCSMGYKGTPTPTSVKCLAQGNWTIVTGCQNVDCHEPHATGYDFTIEQGTLFNSTAGVVCSMGYKGTPRPTSVKCLAQGNWTAVTGCQKVDCHEPHATGYSFKTDQDTLFNSTVGVFCSVGYRGTPKPSSVKCLSQGNWTTVTGCQKVDCHEPHATGYSFTIDHGTLFNSTARVSCGMGYKGTPKPSSVKCLAQGNWTTVTGCQKVDLPDFHPKIRENEIGTNMFTIQWTSVGNADYDREVFEINPSMENGTNITYHERDDHIPAINISNLHPGTLYTISMYVMDEEKRSINSSKLTTYTRPLKPKSAYVSDVQEKNITIKWENDPDGKFNGTNLVVNETGATLLNFNDTYMANETSTVIDNLTGGTEYRVNVSSVVAGLKSEPRSILFYTRPQPLDDANLWFSDETDRSFIFHWNKTTSTHIDTYKIIINDGRISLTIPGIQKTSFPVTNLTSGTEYSLRLYTVWHNRCSEVAAMTKLYTKPQSPEGVVATFNATDEIFLKWNCLEKEMNFMYYNVRIWQPNTMNNVTVESIDKNATTADYGYKHFINRTAGTEYCVSISTILKTPENESIESSYTPICNYTRPEKPSRVTIKNTTERSIVLEVANDMGKLFDEYDVSGFNITQPRNPGSATYITLPHLTPGTYYFIAVFTSIGKNGERQTSPISADTEGFTVPTTVEADSVNGQALNASTLKISWLAGEGNFTGFDIMPDCYNAYNTPLQLSLLKATKNSCYINGLAPGSYCNVTITTAAGNQRSNPYHVTLTNRTYEKAPVTVNGFEVYNVTNQSDTLKMKWDKPEEANGIVRKFYLYIRSQEKCVKRIELDCVDCDGSAPALCKNQDKQLNTTTADDNRADCGEMELVKNFTQADTSYTYSAKRLQAFTSYTVSIQAYTRCLGNVEKSGPVRTDEAVPSEPRNLSAKTVGTDEIVLQWDFPSPVTGIIKTYEINYSYKSVACGSGGPLTNTTTTVNGSQRIGLLTQLHPYWSYLIRIRAATSKGFGQFSIGSKIQTNESAPGKIDNTTAVTEPYSLEIRWNTPCYTNGIIIGYELQLINQNDSTDAKNYSVSPNDTFLNVTEGILPYRNYTIKVRARTRAAAGNFTRKENVQTKTAVPHQPANVTGFAVSSKSLYVSWVPPNLYTGITKYVIEARDSKDHSFVRSCSTSGFLSTACVVDRLDEYWDYTLRVTASTVAGNTSTAFTQTFRTQEDKPGEVAQFNLDPQTDVRLERSINVSWEQPTPRDLNGIIINYTIEYMVNGANYTIDINNNHTFLYQLKGNIKPGSITVQIVAATIKGYGKPSEKTTVVKPGAVLKPNETIQQLVQPASIKVKERERQIAVTLQLQSFLCNNNNGEPRQWGVVVAQDELAQDDPFFGTFDEYRERLKTYKHWSEIKDADVISPYRATTKQWNPCSNFRKRRSTGQEPSSSSSFVVGKDGDCAGTSSNEYCNGQLQPGRSYRVKTFVCTEGGCTESKYSQPIKTAESKVISEKAPDLTVPIVAGVVSVIVVIAAILVVVFLKRRGKVCFAKDIEQHATFERPESLELTKSSKFRPRSIKLVDFPAFVENMQKDSGLLFADAFRLLKDQSPSHPCATAETQACRPKTRYTNILPFDHSRTKLLPLDDEEGSDFINANYIPGYTSRREYIATQGPLPATKDDFWRMVWEQRVDIIVMLTRCIEKGKRKCDQYWPEVVQEPVYSGDLIINIQSESVLSDYIIRIIEVKLKDESRLVRHLAFQKWPDMGSPDETDMLLNFVKAVRQFRPPNSKCPMVVHCSAGVGRTGTFIAVDHILQHIRDHDEVDVYSIILDMRNYRCNMVQTEDQFVYIHECVRDFITMVEQDDEEEEEEHLYENTSGRDNIYENTAFQKD